MTRSRNRLDAREALVGVVIPFLVALVGAVVMMSWLPQLPDPVAVHWGSGDAPDGFGSAWTLVLLPVGSVVGYVVLILVIMLFAGSRGGNMSPETNRRVLLSTSPFLAALLTLGVTGSLAGQRGLADAHDAPGAGLWMLAGAIVGLLLGVVAWFALKPHRG